MQIGTSRIHCNAHDNYIFPARSKMKLLDVVKNKSAIDKWMKDDNLAQHLMHAQHLPGRAAKFSSGHLWHLKSHLDFHWKPVRTELYRETTGSPLTVFSMFLSRPTIVSELILKRTTFWPRNFLLLDMPQTSWAQSIASSQLYPISFSVSSLHGRAQTLQTEPWQILRRDFVTKKRETRNATAK